MLLCPQPGTLSVKRRYANFCHPLYLSGLRLNALTLKVSILEVERSIYM
jgi:hypothetical protein